MDRNKCSDGKLRTYVKFKTVYGRENYLSLKVLKSLITVKLNSAIMHKQCKFSVDLCNQQSVKI